MMPYGNRSRVLQPAGSSLPEYCVLISYYYNQNCGQKHQFFQQDLLNVLYELLTDQPALTRFYTAR